MRPDQLSYSVKCEDGHFCIRARRMLREMQKEVTLISPTVHSTSSSFLASPCANPRMFLQGPLKTLSRPKQTTTTLWINPPGLPPCNSIGLCLGQGSLQSSLSRSSPSFCTLATDVTKEPTRKPAELNSTSLLCSQPGTGRTGTPGLPNPLLNIRRKFTPLSDQQLRTPCTQGH